MCDPTSIAIGSAIMGGGSAIMQGRAQASAAKMQQRIAKHNRDASYVAAREVLQQTSYEISRIKTRADHMVASLRTGAAEGNLRLDKGQPAKLASDMVIMSEIDAKMIEMRGAQKAAGFITQGDTFNAQAAVDGLEVRASYQEAFGSAVHQFGRGLDAWMGRSRPTVPASTNNYNWSMPDYSAPLPSNYVMLP